MGKRLPPRTRHQFAPMDAPQILDRFLDQAALSGRSWVFVVHGHGTGALRNAVREHLRTSPYVAESTRGTREQGGDAVTVARLR